MEKKQLEKMYMYEAVLLTCSKYQTYWSNWPIFVGTVDEFRNLHNELRELNALHKEPIVNFAKVKTVVRKQLVERYEMITGMLNSYADSTLNFRLMELTKISPSRLKSMREENCLAYCREFIVGIEENLPELTPFQIDQVVLDAFVELVNRFDDAIATPRAAIVAHKVLTATIHAKFKDADALLKNRLSSMVKFLRFDAPQFYRAFNYAKKVVQHNGKPVTNAEVIKPSKSSDPEQDDGDLTNIPEV